MAPEEMQHEPEELQEEETEYIEEQSSRDRVSTILTVAIFVVVLGVLTVVGYAVVAGWLNPPAPRTVGEATLVAAQAAVAANPSDGGAWQAYITSLMAANQNAKAAQAIAMAQKAVKDESITSVNVAVVQYLASQGKFDQALQTANAAITKDLAFRQAELKNLRANGVLAAESMIPADHLIKLYVLKSQLLDRQKKYDDAVASLTAALQYDQQASDVMTSRGYIYLEMGRKADAKKDFQNALKFIPDYAPALSGLKKAGE